MRYEITNNSPGPRGIWAKGRLVWIAPGESRTLEADDIRTAQRMAGVVCEPLDEVPEIPESLAAAVKSEAGPLDHDGDGRKGGSRRGAQSTRTRGAAKRRATKAAK